MTRPHLLLNVSALALLAGCAVVQWSNADQTEDGYGSPGTTHDIVANDGSFDSGNLAPGGSFQTTLSGEGTHPYHCSIHPTMTGEVRVTP
jgi:plastocyanin